jgi:hypothetical protein
MYVGVVSDTHGHVPYARAAVRMLESLEVGRVIHCGDIGSPAVVSLFARWPTHFVLGNVDQDEAVLRRTIEAEGQHYHGRFGTLEVAGRQVAFLHGDDERLLQQTISSHRWLLVCHGHTHVAKLWQSGATWVLNPGALYRATPHTIAVVKLPELEITHVRIE